MKINANNIKLFLCDLKSIFIKCVVLHVRVDKIKI